MPTALRWIPYRDEALAFELQRPESWVTLRGVLGAALMLLEPEPDPTAFRSSLNVTAQTQGPFELDQLIPLQLERLARTLTDHRVAEQSATEISSHPARYVESRYREGAFEVALRQWLLRPQEELVLAIAVTMDVSGADELRSVYDRIVHSFRVD